MDEAELLKERLQAITDKRRIQEDIAKKRREIEEEKLKFQYIKKKTLRDQWLMDGLSQQSEEEKEATRIQAQDDQQQSEQLQDNITRIEKEIEALESQELEISANEETVLMRLKEVEKSAEDIIKELNAKFHPDVTHHHFSTIPDNLPFSLLAAGKAPPTCVPSSDEPKKAIFAVEISAKHDKTTGKCEVVSTATVTPDTIQKEGIKVYEDGHKSVYALPSSGAKNHCAGVGEMTVTEVEELLRQAEDKKVPSEVQYHHPVYSVPYKSSDPSRISALRSEKALEQPRVNICQEIILSRAGDQTTREGTHCGQKQGEHRSENKSPSPRPMHQDSTSRVELSEKEQLLDSCTETSNSIFAITEQLKYNNDLTPLSNVNTQIPQDPTITTTDIPRSNPAALISSKVEPEVMPACVQTSYRDVGSQSPSLASKSEGQDETSGDYSIRSSVLTESISPPNHVSEPVTMIFMGYENAVEEENDIQPELVIISNSEEDDYDDDDDADADEYLSYHPQGYKSKVFQPKVGIAKVVGVLDIPDDVHTNCDVLGFHKPTFMHKPGKSSPL